MSFDTLRPPIFASVIDASAICASPIAARPICADVIVCGASALPDTGIRDQAAPSHACWEVSCPFPSCTTQTAPFGFPAPSPAVGAACATVTWPAKVEAFADAASAAWRAPRASADAASAAPFATAACRCAVSAACFAAASSVEFAVTVAFSASYWAVAACAFA